MNYIYTSFFLNEAGLCRAQGYTMRGPGVSRNILLRTSPATTLILLEDMCCISALVDSADGDSLAAGCSASEWVCYAVKIATLT